MISLTAVTDYLEQFAPTRLAEDWDNVGLLVGDRAASVARAMTCLTVTPVSVAEALERGADLIVTHHPLPFRPLKRLTTDDVPGRMLLQLIAAGVAVYSPHTAFDSAREGINQQLSAGLGLRGIEPLIADQDDPLVGAARKGDCAKAMSASNVAEQAKQFLSCSALRLVGAKDQRVTRVAVACGSAGEFLGEARRQGCQMLVTGETSFHTCLEAEATDVALLLLGHYQSERFGVCRLAQLLSEQFPELEAWASERESDPIQLI